jgi:hypothetical protein
VVVVATSAATETVAVASAAREVVVVVLAVLPGVVAVLVRRLLKCLSLLEDQTRQATWHVAKFSRSLFQLLWFNRSGQLKRLRGSALSRNGTKSNVCMIQGAR